MDNNADEQIYSMEPCFTHDDQHPWEFHEYPKDNCFDSPSYVGQLQNLLAYPNFSPPITTEPLAVSTGHIPWGSVELSTTSNPELWQPQWVNDESEWSGINSNSTHVANASVVPYQIPDGPLCNWSHDFKPRPPPLSIPSVPQSLSPAPTSSCPSMEDLWLWHVTSLWSGIMDTNASSSDGDTNLTASGFLNDFAEYDCTSDVRADSQPPATLTHSAISSPQSATFPYSESPICEPSAVLTHNGLPSPQSVTFPYSEYPICEPLVPLRRNAISSPQSTAFPYSERPICEPSVAPTHNAVSSPPSATFPYSESPSCESPRQGRYFKCRWLTDGRLCGELVMSNRCSVVAHVQHFHGIKPGEEKARETCFWEHCRTVLKKESLVRHILTVHLKEKVHCTECGFGFAREDSLKRHLKGSQHKVSLDKSTAKQSSRNHTWFGRAPPGRTESTRAAASNT